MKKRLKGNITIEAAIIIPVFLFILVFLIGFGINYHQQIIGLCNETLAEDRLMITGGHDDYKNPKSMVVIMDGIDDITDQLIMTSKLKQGYSETIDKIKESISNSGFTIE